jgi:hypothetical protein
MVADSIEISENNYFDICQTANLKKFIYTPNKHKFIKNSNLTNIEVLLSNRELNVNTEKLDFFLSKLSPKEINIVNKSILNNCFKICIFNGYLELFKLFEKYCSNLLIEDAFQFQYITNLKTIYMNPVYSNFYTTYNDSEVKEKDKFLNTILYHVLLHNKSDFVYIINKYNYNFDICIYYYGSNIDLIKIYDYKFYRTLKNADLKINSQILNSIIYRKFLKDNSTWWYKNENLLFDIIVKTNSEDVYTQFLRCILDTGNIYFLRKFIEKKPYFFNYKLSSQKNLCRDLCFYLKKLLTENSLDILCSQYEILTPLIVKNNLSSDFVFEINNILNEIVTYENIYKLFKIFDQNRLIIDYNNIDPSGFPVLADCLKYGCINTLIYLLNKPSLEINNNIYIEPQQDLVECSFYNYNYKVCKTFLNHVIINNCFSYSFNKIIVGNLIKTIIDSTIKNNKYYHNSNAKIRKIKKSNLKSKIRTFLDYLVRLDNITNKNINDFYSLTYGELINENISTNFFEKYSFELTNFEFLHSNYIYEDITLFKKIFSKIKKDNFDKYFKKVSYNLDSGYNGYHNSNITYINILENNCQCSINSFLDFYKTLEFCDDHLYINDDCDSSIRNVLYKHLKRCTDCKKCKDNINKCCENAVKYTKKYLLQIGENDEFYYEKNKHYTFYNFIYSSELDFDKLELLISKLFIFGLNHADSIENNSNENFLNILLKIRKELKNDLCTKKISQKTYDIYKLFNDFNIVKYMMKKYIRKKNSHNMKNYKKKLSSINNQFKYEPTSLDFFDSKDINKNNNTISNIIGYQFKKDYFSTFSKNPVHIKPEHLLKDINNTHKYITEKADGIPSIDFISNITNLTNFNLNENFRVQYETINHVKIIYNIVNTNNVFDNMQYLRNLHPYVPLLKDFNFNLKSLEKYCELEKSAFEKYLIESKNNNNTNLWWPKYVWLLDTNYLDYIEKLTILKPCNIFKTDGFILYSNNFENDIYKVKPFELLTIDLKYERGNWYLRDNIVFEKNVQNGNYDENSIYRLYNDNNNDLYIPKEKRIDKKRPNTKEIVDYLLKCHETKWNIDLIFKILSNNKYYQTNNIKSKYFVNLIKQYKFKSFNYIKGSNVLDLGCGYTQNYINKKNDKLNYVCLDNDLKLINSCNVKNKFDNVNYGLFDFTKTIKQQENVFGSLKDMFFNKYNLKYDSIIMLNTIHNGFKDKESLDNFKLNIDNFSQKDSIFIIRYLDKNNLNKILKNENNILLHGNGSYVRKISENKIKIYFTWCHSQPIEETVITKDDITKCFKNKWEIIYEELNKKIYNEDIWEDYFNSFVTIILKKVM